MLVGLTGQLAWTVENMYRNVFLYDTVTTDPTVLAAGEDVRRVETLH